MRRIGWVIWGFELGDRGIGWLARGWSWGPAVLGRGYADRI